MKIKLTKHKMPHDISDQVRAQQEAYGTIRSLVKGGTEVRGSIGTAFMRAGFQNPVLVQRGMTGHFRLLNSPMLGKNALLRFIIDDEPGLSINVDGGCALRHFNVPQVGHYFDGPIVSPKGEVFKTQEDRLYKDLLLRVGKAQQIVGGMEPSILKTSLLNVLRGWSPNGSQKLEDWKP